MRDRWRERGGSPEWARVTYGALLVLACWATLRMRSPSPGDHLLAVATLTALSIGNQIVSHTLRAQLGRVFDMDLGLALVALAVAGPRAALVVVGVPELLYLLRRRRSFCNLGFVANVVSIAATVLAGSIVLGELPSAGPTRAIGVVLAGLAMIVANYLFARLVLAVIRDGGSPYALIRSEFAPSVPVALAAIAIGAIGVLAMPLVGVAGLVGFVALVYAPQLTIARLLRAPSVAALDVDDAAAAYRGALCDELCLARRDRRLVEVTDALVQRRPSRPPDDNVMPAIEDALLVDICRSRPPTQEHFRAPLRVQVVLAARRWAELTAYCTPALSHAEAHAELCRTAISRDAPDALAAAARIIGRESVLTTHVAGVPRLHRTPLPRAIRHDLLPLALARLAG